MIRRGGVLLLRVAEGLSWWYLLVAARARGLKSMELLIRAKNF